MTELSIALFGGSSCSFYHIQKDKTLLSIIAFFLSQHGDSHSKGAKLHIFLFWGKTEMQ